MYLTLNEAWARDWKRVENFILIFKFAKSIALIDTNDRNVNLFKFFKEFTLDT